MAIAVLNDLQQRLHAAAIAGVGVIGEDFRLKKVVDQFSGLTKQSPVFAKIYALCTPLTDPAGRDQATALLEALTMVDAVVCTQGDFKVEGEMERIVPTGSGELRQCRHGQLIPLKDALRDTGSGRYEVIRTAWENKDPALWDFRLRRDLVSALGDSYSELAQMVFKIIREKGAEMVFELKSDFDPMSKKGMPLRVELIHEIAGADENDFYLDLLENSCPEVKAAAIRCLRCSPQNTERLIHLASTEKGNLKKAAYSALGTLHSPQADNFWAKMLKKNAASVLPYLAMNQADAVSDEVADLLGGLLDELLALAKQPVPDPVCERMTRLFSSVCGKTSPRMMDVLGRYAEHAKQLSSLKAADGKAALLNYYVTGYSRRSAGHYLTDPLEFLNRQLIGSLVCGDGASADFVRGLYQKHGGQFLSAAFAADLLESPHDAYDKWEPDFQKFKSCEQMLQAFQCISWNQEKGGYHFTFAARTALNEEGILITRPITQPMDNRWLSTLTDERKPFWKAAYSWRDTSAIYNGWGGFYTNLKNPDDPEGVEILKQYFLRSARRGDDRASLTALKEFGWTDFNDMIPRFLENCDARFQFYVMNELYSQLPMEQEQMVKELFQIIEMIKSGKIRSSGQDIGRLEALAQRMRAPKNSES